MSLTQEVKKEVESFLREGKKIGAIKHLTDTYGFSLNESKSLVEALEQKQDADGENSTLSYENVPADEALKAQVKALLASGNKIEAIKIAKDTLRILLNGAKVWVEDIEREMNPHASPYNRSGSRRSTGGILVMVFIAFGLLFIAGATYIYLRQSDSIRKSDLVSGKVVSMQQNNEGMSAPIIEYEWHGKKWVYASTTYSSPPAFVVDEEVPIYVNRQDPDDITVDTFSERWLVILILGVMGFFFTGIPMMIIFFTSRR